MIKRLLSIILALMIVLSLCSCAEYTQKVTNNSENGGTEQNSTPTYEPVATATPVATPEPAATATPENTPLQGLSDDERNEIIVGSWQKVSNVYIGELTVTYTFYPDGTCVQSTDLGQTSRWVFTDDTHVKITTPLNFTELYELKYENGQWHLLNGGSDYVKVEG